MVKDGAHHLDGAGNWVETGTRWIGWRDSAPEENGPITVRKLVKEPAVPRARDHPLELYAPRADTIPCTLCGYSNHCANEHCAYVASTT